MTRILQRALAGLCAGLLLIIAAELFPMMTTNDSPSAKAAGSMTAVDKTAAPALEAMAAAILERPLFSPARHRPEAAPAAHDVETGQEGPQPLPRRLAGVMIHPGFREALFMREGEKPIAIKVGGEIDGWKIAVIEPDRVILSNASDTQTLKPANAPQVVRPRAPAISMGFGMGPPKDAPRSAAERTPQTLR